MQNLIRLAVILLVCSVIFFLFFRATATKAVYARTSPAIESLTPKEQILALTDGSLILVKIAQAESNFYPQAKNPTSTAKGLFQILDGTWKGAHCQGDVLNSIDNITCAKRLYEKYGTSPWNASKAVWSRTY